MTDHETVPKMTQNQFEDIVLTLMGTIPDLTLQEAQTVISDKDKLIKGVHEVFNQFRIQQPHIEHYTITVQYAGKETIKNLLKEGEYDWVNEDITDKNFPVKKTGKEEIEISLIHFDEAFDNGDCQVIKKLDKLGYKPANPAQLLALGAKYPDLQRQFPIAALGHPYSFAPGSNRSVVCLFRNPTCRHAYLNWLEGSWYSYWRFAALRK